MATRDETTEKFFQEFVLKWEGGFTDKKSGDGHVTLLGMTAQNYAKTFNQKLDRDDPKGQKFHRMTIEEAETDFRRMATAIDHRSGKIKPTAPDTIKNEVRAFSLEALEYFKTEYINRPGFSKIQSDPVLMTVADISYNRGAATTWWVIAKTMADNKGVAFPPSLDPNKIPDPITQRADNPYLNLNAETKSVLTQALNNMVEQQGEAKTIAELAKAKQAHHTNHLEALRADPKNAGKDPAHARYMNGWTNRLNDYNTYYAATHTGEAISGISNQIILSPSAPVVAPASTEPPAAISADERLIAAKRQAIQDCRPNTGIQVGDDPKKLDYATCVRTKTQEHLSR